MPQLQLFESVRSALQQGALYPGPNYRADVARLQSLVARYQLVDSVRLVSCQNSRGMRNLTNAVYEKCHFILGVRIRSTDKQDNLQKQARSYLSSNYLTLYANTVDTGVPAPSGVHFRADVVLYELAQ